MKKAIHDAVTGEVALVDFSAEEEAAFLAIQAAANVVRVPQEVTMRQARLALYGAGLLPSVDAAIAGMTDPAKTAAQIEWNHSQTVQRSKGLVVQLGAALGLTEAQIDQLFITAQGL